MVTVLTLTATAVFAGLAGAAIAGQLPRLGRRAPARRRRAGAQSWLLQAGVRLTPLQFVAGCTVLALATFAVVTVATTAPAVALVPAATVGALPALATARQRQRRLDAVRRAWPDALRGIVAGISAGRSLMQALDDLAREGPQPLRDAFARYPVLARTAGVVPALEVVRAEVADPTTDRVLEVLAIAVDQGGPVVVEVLRDLTDAATADLRATERIATEGLEGSLNARAVFALPWLVLAVLCARPGPFRDFYRSGGGLVVIAIGAAASLLGALLVGRLTRLPPEERVLVRERRA